MAFPFEGAINTNDQYVKFSLLFPHMYVSKSFLYKELILTSTQTFRIVLQSNKIYNKSLQQRWFPLCCTITDLLSSPHLS